MRSIVLPLLAALSFVACAPRPLGTAVGSDGFSRPQAAPKISDDAFARIPKDRLKAVDAARAGVDSLHDAAMRADQTAAVAEQHVAVEESKIKAAGAELDVARAEADLAKAGGDRTRIDDAGLGVRRASARLDLQKAQAELASRERDGEKIQSMLAHANLDLAQAKFENEKYLALKASGDADADRYDGGRFTLAVADAQKKVDLAQSDLQDNRRAMEDARAKLGEAQSALERASAGERVPVRGTDPASQPED
jgi:multidrug resistance efflux pump